jgi:methyltransferase family protein
MAFWAEVFNPARLVGVDQSRRSPSAAFDGYLAERADRLRVHWGVDQGDSERLEALVATEFDRPLDLVIDDASHLYSLTLASLETLLPCLRPGGLYIIEDWAWHHWPALQEAFAGRVPLTRLVTELIEAVGTGRGMIADVSVCQGFAAVRRGPAPIPTPFRLTEAISRGAPAPMSLRQTLRDLGREVGARLRRRSLLSR